MLETLCMEGLGSIIADPGQIEQVIMNLCINARDAMPRGGRITVETSNVAIESTRRENQFAILQGDYVRLRIIDNGSGMDEETRSHLFEPFFTTKEVDKGSGLGLSMVYGFVKQSSGHIKIYSEEGHGTTVRIYLPQVIGAAEPAVTANPSSIEGGHETILVVEDDSLVRTFVVGQIQSLGYATLAAVNAAEAMLVINGPQEIDLLFTDMIMPGSMNGRQLADAALLRRTSLKVLFTSGYSNEAIIHHGHLDAGVLLLAKPYRKSDLARMIRTALAA
jgi:CheY-like chemotaxis protein